MFQKPSFKYHIDRFRMLGALLMLCGLIGGCSSERSGFLARTYHNIAAHYNAYFLASEKMAEIEKTAEQKPDNFDYILPVYHDFDSASLGTLKPLIEECVKFSSMPVVRHGNSRWKDDSYFLIGKARFYEGDFQKARVTFEYIVSSSKDEDLKARAVLMLARVFIEQKVFQNVPPLFGYFGEKDLKKETRRDLFLTKAHFYGKERRYDSVAIYLKRTLPLVKNTDLKGRLCFIEGQIHESLNNKEEARKYYASTAALNLPYESIINARLGMFRVSGISEDAEKFYKKQAKEDKNRDILDKIYYEWALHALRKQDEEEGVRLLQKSLTASADPSRKASSWLKLGELYFDHYKDYEQAKLYYDSAVSGLRQIHPRYEEAQLRKKVLTELVEHVKTIRTEDSLRMLARKDPIEVEKVLDRLAKAETEARKKAAEARSSSFDPTASSDPILTLAPSFGRFANTASGTSVWYFADPSAVAAGQAEFRRIWGDRKLEDHWRRKNKPALSADVPEGISVGTGALTASVVDDSVAFETLKKTLRENIPFSEEAYRLSEQKTEKAFLGAGNVCFLQLRDTTLAKGYFDELLNRFPTGESVPEALYAMHLIHKDDESGKFSVYRDRLMRDYPDTRFAKIALDPEYFIKSRSAFQKSEQLYAEAYRLYAKGHYEEALETIGQLRSERLAPALKDQKEILEAFLKGKLQGEEALKQALSDFLASRTDRNTEAVLYASELLERMKKKAVHKKNTSSKKP